jgi:glyoxylase-like metal-dependent hydrolase (beta-lactamase superfamily II)
MIQRWDIVVIGNLSRNRYWGEGEERPRRPALCTCTLIRGEGFRLLVDPSFDDARLLAAELDRRCGLAPADVDLVFITHEHGDHHAGLEHFPQAAWLAGPEAAAAINASAKHSRPVQAVGAGGGAGAGAGVTAIGALPPGIDLLPTPGHTRSHHSLRFECGGKRVVVCGDAVMTRDFWADRRGYFNSADRDQAARCIDELSRQADLIVPGHDNYFLTR